MAINIDYRQGRTDPVTINLTSDGAAANITGYASVALFLRSADGTAAVEKATGGSGITVTTAASGVISVQFAAADLLFSKTYYTGYVVVVDGSGNRSAFPENDEIRFVMRERYANDD